MASALHVFILQLVIAFSGCSVYMAATKPGRKNLNVIQMGVPRSVVVAELGSPKTSRRNSEGMLEETWAVQQGESLSWKIPRVIFHAAADVFTIGLWEIVGTPTEMLLKKEEKTYVITFDENEQIVKVEH